MDRGAARGACRDPLRPHFRRPDILIRPVARADRRGRRREASGRGPGRRDPLKTSRRPTQGPRGLANPSRHTRRQEEVGGRPVRGSLVVLVSFSLAERPPRSAPDFVILDRNGTLRREIAVDVLVDTAVVGALIAGPAGGGERAALLHVVAVVRRVTRIGSRYDVAVVGPDCVGEAANRGHPQVVAVERHRAVRELLPVGELRPGREPRTAGEARPTVERDGRVDVQRRRGVAGSIVADRPCRRIGRIVAAGVPGYVRYTLIDGHVA